MSDALSKLIAATSAPQTLATKSTKPRGFVKVAFKGLPLFSRALWADATSDDAVANELNTLCLEEPDKAIKIIKAMLADAVVEITAPSKASAASLADLIKSA